MKDIPITPVAIDSIPDADLPPGSMFTKHVTMTHLKECERAINRPLLKHEVQVLDGIMHAQHCANTRLARRGAINGNHSMDEVVSVFVDRLMSREAKTRADRILSNTP